MLLPKFFLSLPFGSYIDAYSTIKLLSAIISSSAMIAKLLPMHVIVENRVFIRPIFQFVPVEVPEQFCCKEAFFEY